MSLGDLNDAIRTLVRLGIAGLNDGGTQWWSLSAAVDERSNAEAEKLTSSVVGPANCEVFDTAAGPQVLRGASGLELP